MPTTVLAAQHHVTFGSRFGPFPVKVALLSRFVSKGEQDKAVQGLADGSVDLVIGTHRLLSKDVRFKDLGLVVVDEEQRFGVAAKERLKQLKREVDVLTLSATPIPRTLNLALAGVRDMSRHRDAAGGSTADPDAGRGGVAPGSSATRSCASSIAAGRSSTSTTGSRRSRPRPSSSASSCPTPGSSSGTARWPRATSRA